ncbi:hypothetical protein ACOALZ_03590 [Nocardiopsis algeriensis]|uniref:hypothetical protein n=1 Tax=Nocardiopsis algeriensis TaxID=1478215 RepID=UPI003B434AB3
MSRHHRSPKRTARPRSCGKRWFKDRISAELALAVIHRYGEDRTDRMPRRAYACPLCEGWHLTSQKQVHAPGTARPTGTAGTAGAGFRVPRPRRAEAARQDGPRLRARQAGKAYLLVQGLEPWVVAYVGDHVAEHGRGPTWRELEAAFGWDRWKGALAVRYLVDRGWLREEPDSPRLVVGERFGGN